MSRSRWVARVGRGRLAARLAVVVPLGMLAAYGVGGSSAAALPSNCSQTGGTVTCTFGFTGTPATWTAPTGVKSAGLTMYGGSGAAGSGFVGAGGSGGAGAEVTGTVSLSGISSLTVNVAGGGGINGTGGYGGGGEAGNGGEYGGGGGGATTVSDSAGTLLIAGGGGGGGMGSLDIVRPAGPVGMPTPPASPARQVPIRARRWTAGAAAGPARKPPAARAVPAVAGRHRVRASSLPNKREIRGHPARAAASLPLMTQAPAAAAASSAAARAAKAPATPASMAPHRAAGAAGRRSPAARVSPVPR